MAKTIWFTGLPCSGKTTIAKALQRLVGGCLLDGDEVRLSPLSFDADFSPEGRRKHLRRVAYVAKLLNDHGVNVFAAFVSPSESVRQEVRDIIGASRFRLVYVNTPAEICEQRDTRGLWAKARRGEIKNFTGVDAPYEAPTKNMREENTERCSAEEIANRLYHVYFYPYHHPASLFIGRFQPFHEGHEKLIRSVLDEGRDVVVAVRDTRLDEDNPYTAQERVEMVKERFAAEIYQERLRVIVMPDIDEVCYGRRVGWRVREIRLDPETEAISATKIRERQK